MKVSILYNNFIQLAFVSVTRLPKRNQNRFTSCCVEINILFLLVIHVVDGLCSAVFITACTVCAKNENTNQIRAPCSEQIRQTTLIIIDSVIIDQKCKNRPALVVGDRSPRPDIMQTPTINTGHASMRRCAIAWGEMGGQGMMSLFLNKLQWEQRSVTQIGLVGWDINSGDNAIIYSHACLLARPQNAVS